MYFKAAGNRHMARFLNQNHGNLEETEDDHVAPLLDEEG
jgi:hypothetical protein